MDNRSSGCGTVRQLSLADAVRLFGVDALEMAQRGAANADVDVINQASALLDRGNRAMDSATAALPSG